MRRFPITIFCGIRQIFRRHDGGKDKTGTRPSLQDKGEKDLDLRAYIQIDRKVSNNLKGDSSNKIGILYRKSAGIRGFSAKKWLLSRIALPSHPEKIPGAVPGGMGEGGEPSGKREF